MAKNYNHAVRRGDRMTGVESRLRDLSEANESARKRDNRDKKIEETLRRAERVQGEEERSEGQRVKSMKKPGYKRGGEITRGSRKCTQGVRKAKVY